MIVTVRRRTVMTDHRKSCVHMQNNSRAVFCAQGLLGLILSAKLEILIFARRRQMDFLDAQPTDLLKKAILDMRKKIKRLEADNDELNERCASLQNELEHLRPTKGETLRLDPAADPRDIAEGAEANAATAERSKATLARPHKSSALASSQAAEPPLKSARSAATEASAGLPPAEEDASMPQDVENSCNEQQAMCAQQQRVVERSGRKFTEITHVFQEGICPAGFKCGDEFGVQQFVGIFTEEELRAFEAHADDMIAHDERWLENTLDVSPPGAPANKRTRSKYFFPKYTYGDGQTPKRGDCDEQPLPPGRVCSKCKGAQSLHTERCNNIPEWIYRADQPCLASILVEVGILENGWATSAILNVYHKRGGKLLAHFDSPHLFERPIIALSLFSAKSLSFGVKGLGMRPQEHHYKVDMPRGAVTIMEGYAANRLNHGVQPVREKVASLLLRRMHPTLLDEEWLARNTMVVNTASAATTHPLQTTKQCSSSSSSGADGEDAHAVNRQGLSIR